MGCFIPHKRQSIGVWPVPPPSLLPSDFAWCFADWTCRFVLIEPKDAVGNKSTIIDTETHNCVSIDAVNDHDITDIWFDGEFLYCCGQAETPRWCGQLFKFDENLNLISRKVVKSSDDALYFRRIIESNGLLYVGGRCYFPYAGVVYEFTKDFVVQTSYSFGTDGFDLFVGKIGENVVFPNTEQIACLDNTFANVGFLNGRSSNNVFATKSRFFVDKTSYYTITEPDNAITHAWFFSPTKTHACCGAYVVKFDPNDNFRVIKAVYTDRYNLFGCTDNKFVGLDSEAKLVVLYADSIDVLLQQEGFYETTVDVQKFSLTWDDCSFGTRAITEASFPVDVIDGDCGGFV